MTGATGFLGRSVARRLAARGHSLRLLTRRASNLAELPPDSEAAIGDVTDAVSFARAAEGCDAVLHLAALVKLWVPDPERFHATNVGGFENAPAAARAAGARLVYTSSFIALGPSGSGAHDASRPHPGPPFRNAYERTKALADAAARAAAERGGDVVILYPGVIYGPGEMTEGNLVVRMIADHMNGRLPGLVGPGDRRWSYAYVEDVAEGHALALEKGKAGDRFVLGGENATLRHFFELLQEIAGTKPPRLQIPYAVASWSAARSGCGRSSRAIRRSSPTARSRCSARSGPATARRPCPSSATSGGRSPRASARPCAGCARRTAGRARERL